MIPRILCAHDLTDSSDAALRTAVGLGRRLGAELTILFASTPYPAAAGLWYALAPSFEGIEERIGEAARAELATRVKACTGADDPPVSLVTEVRDPGEAILETVKAMRPDLVVLGTHARTGWQHLLLGSVAERVVRESPVPVVTVRPGISVENAASAPRGPIVCATDLTENSRAVLGQALRMAAALHIEICVLYVSPPLFPDPTFRSLAAQETLALHGTGARVRREAAAALADLVLEAKASVSLPGVASRTLVVEGLPAETIVAQAQALGAELIVLGTHGRTGLPRLLLGSVAERVLRTADRPVLTVAPEAATPRQDQAASRPASALPAR